MKKVISKKLELHKTTIANLQTGDMDAVKGGFETQPVTRCGGTKCPTLMCPTTTDTDLSACIQCPTDN